MRDRVLTAKGAATRQRIVEGAAARIRETSVAETSLADVCAESSTGKSQLFHYFPGGKDDLLVAVTEHEARSILEDQEPYLSRLNSWEEWDAWRGAVVSRYAALGRRCPLGVLMTQLGPSSSVSERIATRLLTDWQGRVRDGISSMQKQQLIRSEIDAGLAAEGLVAAIYGGVVIMLITGSTNHLDGAIRLGIRALRGTD